MEERRCAGPCHQLKSFDAFSSNWRGNLQPRCDECMRAARVARYAQNEGQRANTMARNARFIEKKRQIVWDYLVAHPCMDCGEDDPIVLEFDHVRGEKLYHVAHLAGNTMAISRMMDEISKCEVVCANCHRRRTAERGGHWKHVRGLNE